MTDGRGGRRRFAARVVLALCAAGAAAVLPNAPRMDVWPLLPAVYGLAPAFMWGVAHA